MNKKYAAILLLAAAAVWTSGCSPQPISSQQAKPIQATKAPSAPAIKTDSKAASDEGIKKYQAGDYDKAIEDFDKALALDADNYQALSNKGVTLAMRGNALFHVLFTPRRIAAHGQGNALIAEGLVVVGIEGEGFVEVF